MITRADSDRRGWHYYLQMKVKRRNNNYLTQTLSETRGGEHQYEARMTLIPKPDKDIRINEITNQYSS